MAISRLKALEIATAFVKAIERRTRPRFPLIVIEEATIEEDFGWIISYNVENYKDRNLDVPPAIVGNGPFIVTRADGRIYETGTAHPLEFYIELFRRTGTTNPDALGQ